MRTIRPALGAAGALVLVGCTGLIGPLLLTQEGPCKGYRTEAVFVDGTEAWLGCGSDPGLFRASNVTLGNYKPVAGFGSFRVFDIEKAPDGRVLIAGGDSGSSAILVSINGSAKPQALLSYSGKAPFMRISDAENIAVTAGGKMMTDSLTGLYAAVGDGTAWEELYYWTEGSLDGKDKGFQAMQLVAHGEDFYGVGSLIHEPPVVFVPSRRDDATYHFATVFPGGTARKGALESLAVLPDGRMHAVGVDQSSNRGVMFSCPGECADAASWQEWDLAAQIGVKDSGKLWAIHFDDEGKHGVAVGEHMPQSKGGYAMVTSDGGVSWRAVRGDFPILTAARSMGSGQFVIAGGDGYLATGKL